MSNIEETETQRVEAQESPITPLGDLEPLANKLVGVYSERIGYFMRDLKKKLQEVESSVKQARFRQVDGEKKGDAGAEEIEWSAVLRNVIELKNGLEDAEAGVRNTHRWQADTEPADMVAPQEVDWRLLESTFAEDATRGLAAWERLKRTAIDEAESGNRAVTSLYPTHTPWERAQFLALWYSIRDEVEPRGGIELALVDTMALAFAQHLAWLTTADNVRAYEAKREE